MNWCYFKGNDTTVTRLWLNVGGAAVEAEQATATGSPRDVTHCSLAASQLQQQSVVAHHTRQPHQHCIEQLSDILAPNAFAPEGINKEFKPRIVFGEMVDYRMEIFDRWGKRIFVSTDQEIGWTGKDGFFYYPSAVYVYIIRIVQTNGRTVEKQGNVILIRQRVTVLFFSYNR